MIYIEFNILLFMCVCDVCKYYKITVSTFKHKRRQ